MGNRVYNDLEREVDAVAETIPCTQPDCHAKAGKRCRHPWGFIVGSSHLGRVRAAGALPLMPLVAAWDRGEIR